MKKVKIKINNKELIVDVVKTKDDMYKGLSGRSDIANNYGMLFLWKEDKTSPVMVMRDMNFSLDFIAFGSDGIITDLKSVSKDYKDDINFKDIKAIIEVKKGFIGNNDIKIGDKVIVDKLVSEKDIVKFKGGGTTKYTSNAQVIGDIKIDINTDKTKPGYIYLLDKDGNIVMELKGKERIFSITHTNELFELAKEAKATGDYKKLGERLQEIMDIHDVQEPEYAEEV